MNDTIRWILAVILVPLVFGAYVYSHTIDKRAEELVYKSESRIMERMDRVDDKLDRLLDKLTTPGWRYMPEKKRGG